MKFQIKALDTLFFRDSKPFARGEETWADGIFPPFPSVVYGALRTWFISNHKEAFSEDVIQKSAAIIIKSIQYRVEGSTYFPMPLDMAEMKGKEKVVEYDESDKKAYKVLRLILHKMEGLVSSYPFEAILLPPVQTIVKDVEQGLIQLDDFKQYLNSPQTDYKIRKVSDFAPVEPKVGIGRNDFSNTASDALLYRVGMRRASEFEILTNFELPDNETPANQSHMFTKLGAENKVVELRQSRQDIDINKDEITLKPGRFKLYLSTPGIFENGWAPDLSKHGINATLVGAAVGKPLHIGGFDIKKGKPKTMYKAVPAGSVYFYETEESTDNLKNKLFGKSISEKMSQQADDEIDFDKQGFGIAYIGNWEFNK